MFKEYFVIFLHKHMQFGERLYKYIDCGDIFICLSQLKSDHQLYKSQKLSVRANSDNAIW